MNQNERNEQPIKPIKPARKSRKKKKKARLLRVKNPHLWRNIGIVAAIAAALFLTLSVFFRIDSVSVSGNSFYSSEQIIEASGVQNGDNLLAMSKSAVSGRICKALPYISSVQVRRVLPDQVVIDVKESSVTFALRDETGGIWLTTSAGRIVEHAADANGHIPVEGLTLQSPELYQELLDPENEITPYTLQLQTACAVMKAIEESDLFEQITSVTVPEDFHVTCRIGDQYQVTLGSGEDYSYKLRYLQSVLSELDSFSTGEIDLTFNGGEQAVFRPAR